MENNIERIYGLTPLQEGMLFHKLTEEQTNDYFIQNVVRIHGDLSVETVKQSLVLLARKHAVLRTAIFYRKIKHPRQIILKEKQSDMNYIDITHLSNQNQLHRFNEIVEEDVKRDFDLETDSLLRFTIVKFSDDLYKMVWSFHHIILDGWSASLLMKDFMSYYERIHNGETLVDLNHTVDAFHGTHPTFEGFINWLSEQDKESAMAYWENLLKDYSEPVEIQAMELAGEDVQDNKVSLSVDVKTNNGLVDVSRQLNVTVNTIVEAAWGILLQKYNSANDAVFGKVVSGRNINLSGIDQTAGLFINTVPVRVKNTDKDQLADILVELQKQGVESSEYDFCSLADIQEQTKLKNALFNTIVAFENYYTDYDKNQFANLAYAIELEREQTNYPLSLIVYPSSEKTVTFELLFNPDLFKKGEATKLLKRLDNLLVEIATNPYQTFAQLELVTTDERQLILDEFNQTSGPYPHDKTIQELFDKQVELNPNAIALIDAGEQITYQQLYKKSNQMVGEIKRRGIKEGELVGIFTEKSIEMIAGLLAIVKSGCGYVPIDPDYPDNRINHILKECSMNLILSSKEHQNEHPAICNHYNWLDIGVDYPNEGSSYKGDANDIAYVTFTSGSTGKPKGVVVEHKNVLRLVKNTNYVDFEGAHILQTGSLSFDAATFEIWGALLNGGLLRLAESDLVMNWRDVERTIKEHHINMMWLTSQLFNNLVDENPSVFSDLKYLLIGGEKLSPKHVNKALRNNKEITLINGYGPTENTTFSLTYTITDELDHIPIGKPIQNSTAYILNGDKLCGLGMVGELCVGGEGVSRGYLNMPELTERKFVLNPYKNEGRIYRTGDLARWLPDGNIEYLGRMDAQVKLRGFRIELDEIESVIKSQKGVADAAVAIKEDHVGESVLCGYLVRNKNDIIDMDNIKKNIRTELPEYMVPAVFQVLDKLPVTPNGKLERGSLPKLLIPHAESMTHPVNETEEKVLSIFQDILGLTNIGTTDNFFEMGGHSLRATRAINRVEAAVGIRLSLNEMFENPTVQELGQLINGKNNDVYIPIPAVDKREYYTVSSSQKRLYVLNEMEGIGTTYNITGVFELEGYLDLPRVRQAFKQLVDRHEALRTGFSSIDNAIVQFIEENVDIDIETHVNVKDTFEEKINLMNRFVKPFNLDKAPLIRFMIAELTNEKSLLFFDIHHIISDGMSINILIDDFNALYQGEKLDANRIHYKDFSEWMQSRDLSEQKKYWLENFSTVPDKLNVPLDYARPKIKTFKGNKLVGSISNEMMNKVLNFGHMAKTTEYMVYLSAVMILLHQYSGQEDIVVGSPVSGRTHKDTENMVGMFVNTLAIRTCPVGDKKILEFLEEVKKSSLYALKNQDYPFEELVEEINLPRDISRNPLFDVMFVLQNNEGTQLKMGEREINPIDMGSAISKFDLTFSLDYSNSGYELTVEYSTDLFTSTTIKRLMGHYMNILNEITNNPDQYIKNIDYIGASEKDFVINKLNSTKSSYPNKENIVNLFEAQVEKTPHKTALYADGNAMTYAELNKKANQLARKLKEMGVSREDFIVIFCEKNMESIIGILGTIKAGAAYVPIEPSTPKNRINFILFDCDPKAVIIDTKRHSELINTTDYSIIDMNEQLSTYHASNLMVANEANDLIYCMYTSGTTGNPKGVMIEHKNVIRLVKNTNYIQLDESTTILQTGALSFDASTFEIWGPLLNGGCLCLVDNDILTDPALLKETIQTHNINTMWLTASLYNQMIDADQSLFNALDHLLIGGEKLSEKHVRLFKEQNQHTDLINGYGPTEGTTFTTTYHIPATFNSIPIGRPISNTEVYIMKNEELCGIGVPGELCIAGDGVGRGYLHQPELTQEKFIPNPFGEGRMYKSGDLVRWLHDGSIEYLGRMDEQVKIRGFRIELGEVENAILDLDAVQNAVVLAKHNVNGETALYAYYVSENKTEVNRLKGFLKSKLPDYMIPSYMMRISSIPTNKNGKLDREKLPDVEIMSSSEYVAPRTEKEKKLAEIYNYILGTQNMGVNDNFFEFGGHSLRATSVINKIQDVFGIRPSLNDMFTHPTIEEMGLLLDRKNTDNVISIPKSSTKDFYPMSSIQKRVYIIQEIDDVGTAYNIPTGFEIQGRLELEKVNAALNELISRHEILRTSFHMIGDEAVQKIDPDVTFIIYVDEIDDIREQDYQGLMKDFVKPFDLSNAPLLRVKIIEISNGHSLLFIDMHHIISDGMSMHIFMDEFFTLYEEGKLAEVTVQYKDYSEWMEKRDLTNERSYWLQEFSEQPVVLDLPFDYPRPQTQGFKGHTLKTRIDKKLKSKLTLLSQKTDATDYMLLLSAFIVLLKKYSRAEDITVGTPVSGRTHRDTEKMFGMFVNTLAIRSKPQNEMKFIEFLAEIKSKSLKAIENQDFPFEQLIEETDVHRDLSRNPLFDVMFALQNNENIPATIDGNPLKELVGENEIAKFDLTFNMENSHDCIILNVEYNTDLFKMDTIHQLMDHYQNILVTICRDPEQRLGDLTATDTDEQNLIINQFNDTMKEHTDKTVVEIFEEQVKKTPGKTAVNFNDEEISYHELNQRANQLARLIRNKGIQPDEFVAIYSKESIELIIGLIGVLKAGGAYVPIDPDYPEDRINYMLSDCEPKVILKGKSNLPIDIDIPVISLDDNVDDYPDTNLSHVNKLNDLIYVIYTSGTTGKPKGVMIEHKNAIRLVKETDYVSFNDDVNILQTGSLSFDASTFEIWGPLLNGGKVCLSDTDVITNSKKLKEKMSYNKINMMFVTTQLFNNLIDQDPTVFNQLEYVLFGGELLSKKHTETLLKYKNPELKIIHCYGPTENTTFSLTYLIEEGQEKTPIGKPIQNSTAYILDDNSLSGIGMPGELCVGGKGVARGYLNKPGLTKEKFIENPFVQGETIYLTGDLARWLPDGNIEFLGRRDDQVKIRGFRIEIGEIESVIRNIPAVQDVKVVVTEVSGEKSLLAYFVSNIEIDPSEIKNRIQKALPEYMVPPYIQQLDSIPLNINGKLDKSKLPELKQIAGSNFEEPKTDVEKKIAKIFEDILNVQKIGLKDHFFELGGHSLKAASLVNKIENSTGIRFSLKDIFSYPTVEGLCAAINGRDQEEEYKPIPPVGGVKNHYPLSSAQKRMYILQELDDVGTAYNIPVGLEIEGYLKKDKVERVINTLIERHEALRTCFDVVDEDVVQMISPEGNVELEYDELDDATSLDKEEIMKAFIRPFDLKNGHLLRVKLVKYNANRYLLLFDLHHIISDGMSMNILIDEFSALYNDLELSPVYVHYKDYSEWINAMDLSAHKNYWLEELMDAPASLDLPTDYVSPQSRSYKGNHMEGIIDKQIRGQVRSFAKETGTTEYQVLLSAYILLLSKYSRQEDIVVGSPVSGRTHSDTENMLGMFVNTLALRAKPKRDMTFLDFLLSVKETSLKAFEYQAYPFEQLLSDINVSRDFSKNPLFDCMFVLQNFDHKEIRAKELKIKEFPVDNPISKFDITATVSVSADSYKMNFEFSTDLFKEATIAQMMQHYRKILQEAMESPLKKIRDIEEWGNAERNMLLNTFNDTVSPVSSACTFVDLFEEHSEANGFGTAVVFQDTTLSYKALNEKANQLARRLRHIGIGKDDRVGIHCERSIEMIIGILGVLKAGGAYVPIDIMYPENRKEYILGDSRPVALLSGNSPLNIETDIPVINLMDADLYLGPSSNLRLPIDSEDLMYILYTSGTTGRPKGVMVEHRGVVNLQHFFVENFQIQPEDRILQFANLVFDASVSEITMALLTGASLYVIDENDVADIHLFNRYVDDNAISVVTLPPQYYFQTNFRSPRLVITAGSETNKLIVKKAKTHARYVNGYGPTENTVWATYWDVKETDSLDGKMHIGKPITNSQIYIMNDNHICGTGVPGELCIAGNSLARGYMNLQELTKEKFIENPFGKGRLYKSGDLARWNVDGNIEFLGRIDDQRKVRGFRIELGEIETAVREIDSIEEVAVVVRNNQENEKDIYAYFVSTLQLNINDLKDELRLKLPNYMIPAHMMQIETMPLTRNGKIDYKALPEMTVVRDEEYVAPRNDMEHSLVRIFEEILEVSPIGIYDNFFDMGGDSIKAIRVISKLREAGYELTIKELMESNSIIRMTHYLAASSKTNNFDQNEVVGQVPLTPIQQTFFNWNLPRPHHFNQSVMLEAKEEISESAVAASVHELVKHHDILRATFKEQQQIIQDTSDSELFDLQVHHLEHINDDSQLIDTIERESNKIQSGIDIHTGPMVKVALFKTKYRQYVLICIHHLVVDGVSWRIFMEDFETAYTQYQLGITMQLPKKTASYKQWAETLQMDQYRQKVETERDYWSNVLRSVKESEFGFTEQNTSSGNYSTTSLTVNKETTDDLLYKVNDAYGTGMNDILFTALGIAMKDWCGEEKIGIEMEGHGRDDITKDIQVDRTVGWMTSLYPVMVESTGTTEENIVNTKEMLRQVPNNGIGYGVIKYSSEDPLFNKTADISFNYLGHVGKALSEGSIFTLSDFPTGNEVSSENGQIYSIAFNGMISDGCFQLNIGYDNETFTDSQMEELRMCYENALSSVINQCLSQTHQVKTPSDYHQELSSDVLEEIEDLFS